MGKALVGLAFFIGGLAIVAAVCLGIDYLIYLAVNFLLQPWHQHVGYWWVVVAILVLSVIGNALRGGNSTVQSAK